MTLRNRGLLGWLSVKMHCARIAVEGCRPPAPIRPQPCLREQRFQYGPLIEIFAGDEILTTAILDRLLHHVVVVHIDGHSYRLRELGALLGPKPDAPRPPSPQPGGDR
jgi:hypothetical protein